MKKFDKDGIWKKILSDPENWREFWYFAGMQFFLTLILAGIAMIIYLLSSTK